MSIQPVHQQAIFLALSSIPAGRVVTYGQLAALAGLPRAARLAGRCLRELPEDSQLPWHRVINAQGRLSLPEGSEAYELQRKRLGDEGVELVRGKINLRRFGWLAPGGL